MEEPTNTENGQKPTSLETAVEMETPITIESPVTIETAVQTITPLDTAESLEAPSVVEEEIAINPNEIKKEELPTGTVMITTPANVVTQLMDIAEPLSQLKALLSKRVQCDLTNHEIYLQNATKLDGTKSLVEQGVNTDGVVQFSTQIISVKGLIPPRINIVDVVKPIIEPIETPPTIQEETASNTVVVNGNNQVTKWIVCNNYRDEQEKQGIPYDPHEWTEEQTSHWLQWAAAEFGLVGEIDALLALKATGREVCSWSKEDFVEKLPKCEAVKLLWTHLQILVKGKPVSKPINSNELGMESTGALFTQNSSVPARRPSTKVSRPNPTSEDRILPGNRTGNNGQIQLWQFLLELLTDKDSLDIIEWIDDSGEFKLLDAEQVAKIWGVRKNKLSMNYEKLSRALRYYYDGDMIAKVHGKRFVYKFVCDLKNLIGYDAGELHKLVLECKNKSCGRPSISTFTL